MTKSVQGVGGLAYDSSKRSWPNELNVFLALVLLVVGFELTGRIFLSDSFLFNTNPNLDTLFNEARLQIIILQVSIVGIIAIGVTQVIISGGIDLSAGSVVGATAMIAMSFAQAGTVNGGLRPPEGAGPDALQSRQGSHPPSDLGGPHAQQRSPCRLRGC